jgi:RNA 2',3'-cyclic 3'-phosphodiesterase
MRLFYAALFPPSTLKNLRDIQEELKAAGVRGRFIPRDNFHLTLHFLGETDAGELCRLTDRLDEVARTFCPEPLKLTRTGFFRQGRRDLLYVGADDSSGSLGEAARLLRDDAGKENLHRFKPHITLVRNATVPGDLRRTLGSRSFTFPARPVQALALMESRPGRGGVIYIPLHQVGFPL